MTHFARLNFLFSPDVTGYALKVAARLERIGSEKRNRES